MVIIYVKKEIEEISNFTSLIDFILSFKESFMYIEEILIPIMIQLFL
jgi:hypothetical protein